MDGARRCASRLTRGELVRKTSICSVDSRNAHFARARFCDCCAKLAFLGTANLLDQSLSADNRYRWNPRDPNLPSPSRPLRLCV